MSAENDRPNPHVGPPCPACGEPLSADGACWSCDWGPTPDNPDPRVIPPASCGCPVSGFGYRHHRHPCSRAGENENVIPPGVDHD